MGVECQCLLCLVCLLLCWAHKACWLKIELVLAPTADICSCVQLILDGRRLRPTAVDLFRDPEFREVVGWNMPSCSCEEAVEWILTEDAPVHAYTKIAALLNSKLGSAKHGGGLVMAYH